MTSVVENLRLSLVEVVKLSEFLTPQWVLGISVLKKNLTVLRLYSSFSLAILRFKGISTVVISTCSLTADFPLLEVTSLNLYF